MEWMFPCSTYCPAWNQHPTVRMVMVVIAEASPFSCIPTPTLAQEARRLVEELRKRALDLPFAEVGELWN